MTVAGTPFAAFPKAAFAAIEFPYSKLSVTGGTRHAIHEFPHTSGGEIEKQGRKPYSIKFSAWFHDVPGSELEVQYPNLYPVRLRQLRDQFEREVTADLIVPNIGTIKAYAINWTQDIDVRVQSGESFEIEFLEDQPAGTLVDLVTKLGSYPAVQEASDELFARAAIADFKSEAAIGVFQQINDALTAVEGAFGTADAYTRVVEGKVQALVNLCALADSSLQEMQDPSNVLMINALKDLWLAAIQLATDVSQSQQQLLTYIVPARMAIGQVSTAIYGSSEKAYDLMQLNAFDDALSIPAGTTVKYLTA